MKYGKGRGCEGICARCRAGAPGVAQGGSGSGWPRPRVAAPSLHRCIQHSAPPAACGRGVRGVPENDPALPPPASRPPRQFAVLDGRFLINGSFNWTRGGVLENEVRGRQGGGERLPLCRRRDLLMREGNGLLHPQEDEQVFRSVSGRRAYGGGGWGGVGAAGGAEGGGRGGRARRPATKAACATAFRARSSPRSRRPRALAQPHRSCPNAPSPPRASPPHPSLLTPQENVLILDAPKVAANYTQQFEKLWAKFA